MSTRGLIRVYDEEGQFLICIYNRNESQPDGLGNHIKYILNNGTVYFSSYSRMPKFAADMTCVAGFLFSYLKLEYGEDVRVMPENHYEFDYSYKLFMSAKGLSIECVERDKNKVLYSGLLTEFDSDSIDEEDDKAP